MNIDKLNDWRDNEYLPVHDKLEFVLDDLVLINSGGLRLEFGGERLVWAKDIEGIKQVIKNNKEFNKFFRVYQPLFVITPDWYIGPRVFTEYKLRKIREHQINVEADKALAKSSKRRRN